MKIITVTFLKSLKMKLFFSGIDSLFYEISTVNIYEEFWRDNNCFNLSVYPRIIENVTDFRTRFLLAVFCKIGALERNAY